MNKILSPTECTEFQKLVRKTKNVDEKTRLCAVLAYDIGHTPCDIAEILQISETTAYKYVNDYIIRHKTSHDPKGGSECRLTPAQEVELISHLHEITYLYAKDICAHVLGTYKIKYTASGMTKWLNRNEFTYKEPLLVPGKLDRQKQEEFIEYYEDLKENVSCDETIMFMDAVHPEYQSQAVRGWIPRGTTKTISTTNKQFRLHLNGTIDIFSKETFIQEYGTINGENVIEFFKQLEQVSTHKIIHIICDNGRSYKNKEVQIYLQTSRIKLHYLPAYSPNLNPIERLWKIFREHVCYNKYYPVFAEFANNVRGFFSDIIPKIPHILAQRINDKFQVIYPNPVRLSS